MQLNITRPICFFDLETTGVNVAKDRIVEISILKVFPDGREEEFTERINPTVPIPAVTTAVHGISDADVADKPTFAERAKEIYDIIKDSDLAGFNSNRFDIPLLVEELLRSGIDFDMKNRNAIDV
jgi:DNA polymerase-3 subunit epsilon